MPAQRSALAVKAWILGSVAAGLLTGFPFGSAFAQEPLIPRVTAGKKPASQLQAIASAQQVVVKFREGSGVRVRGGSLLASESGVATSFQALLADLDVPLSGLRRMHSVPEGELDAQRLAGEQASGRQLADLNLYYILDIPAALDPATVAARLNGLAGIEFAEPMPLPPPPPVDIAPATPDLRSGQTYKNDPPGGIGANQVSSVPGSNGLNMAFADVEYSWQLDHEDLELPASRVIVRAGCTASDPFFDTNHGTAVLGEIVGEANGYGVTGIAPASTARMSPANCTSGYNPASAVSAASAALSPGDVIVIEQQFPACGGACGASQVGCGPLEAFQPAYDAIAAATAAGRVVVAAAGNGSVNLDAPSCGGLFNRSVRDSGAIIVGAGSPSDRSRLSFSSFGARVDVQGWGSSVTTTGYGDAFVIDPPDIRQRYTNFFGGTSSATPIVSGAVLAIQGIRKACGLGVTTSTQVRTAMASTGTPQGAGAAGNIGPLPRIREAVIATGAGGCLPGGGKNDLLVDFGASGLWIRLNNVTWTKVSNSSPVLVGSGDLDNSGKDEAIASVAPGGLVARYNNTATWTQLTSLVPTVFAVGNLNGGGEDIIADFGASGIYVYYNNATWTKLHNGPAQDIETGDLDGNGQDEALVDFGASGLWARLNNSSWTKLHNLSPTHIATGDLDNSGREDAIVDFGASGIWVFYNNVTWSKLHNSASQGIETGDLFGNARDDVVIDFGAAGLWAFVDNTGFSKLHNSSPTAITTVDLDGNGQDNVVANFGGPLWVRIGGTWVQVHPGPVQVFTGGGFD